MVIEKRQWRRPSPQHSWFDADERVSFSTSTVTSGGCIGGYIRRYKVVQKLGGYMAGQRGESEAYAGEVQVDGGTQIR